MKFQYKKFSSGVLRPIFPIEVVHDGRAVRYEVLVDSGADMCLFDIDIADVLGIPLEKMRHPVAGIGGKDSEYVFSKEPVELLVGGWPIKTKVGFMKLPTDGHGIVGQFGFFEAFIVTFDLQKRVVELKQRK